MQAYNENMYLMELMDMAHKLFLTSMLLFFSMGQRAPIGMGVSTVYTFVILLKTPFIRAADGSSK